MYELENAIAEIVKERNRIEREIRALNAKVDGFKERIERHVQEIHKYENLLTEYDQIIETLEGVKA